jgi:aspartate aminotransferase-like enzyme
MYTTYRTVIAGQRTKLRGKVIRIGTMGFCGAQDILADLHYLECTLRDLGHAPAPGAGVQAATAVLAQ